MRERCREERQVEKRERKREMVGGRKINVEDKTWKDTERRKTKEREREKKKRKLKTSTKNKRFRLLDFLARTETSKITKFVKEIEFEDTSHNYC